MNKPEYIQFHAAACEEMKAITLQKNADYTGSSDDPFANFTLVESFGVATTEQGMFTRMLDKISRLASFIQKGILLVKSESVYDTLLDLANYCILLAGYLKSKESSCQTDKPEA